MKEKTSLLRLSAVKSRTGLGRSSIYLGIKSGTFPAPIQLTRRCVAWPDDVIDAWIAERISAGAKA